MKPFPELTNHGKLRRMHQLASIGLTHYDIPSPQITFHGFETNLLYRVTAGSGERYMLRLAYPGWRTLTDLRSEAMWLTALCADTNIPAPEIIPAGNGEQVLSLSVPGIPDPWHMTLMRWVPGRLLGHYLTEENLEKMGKLFAELHRHGADWKPPEGFTKRRFEHWLSRGEENCLEMLSPPTILAPHRDVLARMSTHVEDAYQALDRSDLRVIHCDLWHDNIKLHRGVLHPFDFEDTVWGFRAHDIAMAMLDLLETVGEVRYPALLAAFQQGYTSQMRWPDEPIEPFQVGRLLWMINWVARFEPQDLAGMITKQIPVFRHYERTGQVTLPDKK